MEGGEASVVVQRESPQGETMIRSEKPRGYHAWRGGVAAALLLLALSCQAAPGATPIPDVTAPAASPESGQVSFTGTVRTGAELGEVKGYCAEGLYLVAEEGFLVGQTSMLLLRRADPAGLRPLLATPQLVGQRVQVVGRYPAQEGFCEALTCECEDYILVDEITPQP